MIKRRMGVLLFFLFSLFVASCNSNHVADKPDKTKPTILSTSPANNATAVGVTTAITVTFSEAMNASTINDSTFYLISAKTGTVAGTVSYDSASHVATFTAGTPLDNNNTKYTATIAGSVADASGNTLGSNHSWSFTAAFHGALDLSFESSGLVRLSLGPGNDTAYAAALQQDGKILTAGLSSLTSANTSTQYFTLARFLTNGTLDTTFGLPQNGKAEYFTGAARCVRLQSDGNIVAAGSNIVSSSSFTADSLIARYNADGTRDSQFGTNGAATMNVGGYTSNEINSLVIQSDGNIVVVGDGTNDGSTYASLIARVTATGILDTSFATNGTGTNIIGGVTSQAWVVKIQPTDGKIVVGGNFRDGSGHQSFYLARYESSGTLDTLFSSGIVTASTSTNCVLADIEILPSGEILVAGTMYNGTPTNDDIFLMRYRANGALDTNFGASGIVITDDGNNGVDTAARLAAQTDGKIIVAATFGPTVGSPLTKDFVLFRYNADGSRDTTFGNGYGMSSLADFGYDAYANDVLLQQDGKIVVVGSVSNGSNSDVGLARYWP